MNRFGEYTMDGVGNSETNVPSLPKDKHIPDLPGFRLELELSMGSGYLGQTDPEEAGRRRSLDGFRGGTRFAQSMLISDLAIQYYELIGLDRRKEVVAERAGQCPSFP